MTHERCSPERSRRTAGVSWGALLCSLALTSCGAACNRNQATPFADNRTATAVRVVVYCSADKEFAEPVFAAYEAKTGVKVLPLYDTEETKTAGLTARLLAEKSRPQADVFWSSDTSRAVAIVDHGVVVPYVPTSADTIPARYKDPNGRWTGFAGRIRVLLYNTARVNPSEVPRSIHDLTTPRWKGKVAVANPHFGTMSFHTAALFVRWGDATATAFLRQLKQNDVVIAAGNSDVKDRVADGRVDVGLMDEDDAVVAVRDKGPVAIAILDQEGPTPLGTPLMPNVALLVQGAPHQEAGKRFIDFLVSAEAETMLARSDAAQYPLHQGVAGPARLPPLAQLHVMDVDYVSVSRRLDAMDAAVRTIFGR